MSSIALVASTFHSAAQVSRKQLYGTEIDPQLPLHLQADARIPFLGFCGPRFGPGCPVLLGINPGGGGDAYDTRTTQDAELIPLIEAFVHARGGDVEPAFIRMASSYMKHAMTWNFWRILEPTLTACGAVVEEVCYVNLFPYRTRKDARPAAAALQRARNEIATPLLHALKPSKMVALGKKAGDVVQPLGSERSRMYVVPRTIGDTYVSDEARIVLEQIRSAT